jgi:cardiolipin synthase
MSWRREEIYVEGDGFFEALLGAIAQARHTIELEMYIFTTDPLARRFVAALKEARRRGVSVRVLLDGVGSYGSIAANRDELRGAGVEVRVYHPVRLAALFRRLLGLPSSSPLRRFFATLNRRNHRKVCIIDMREAWLGSINISAVHSRQQSGEKAWRDTAVRLSGVGVRDLRRAFERVWYSPAERRRWSRTRRWAAGRVRVPERVWLNWKGRQRRRNFREIIERINRAEQRIRITNAYFVPHGALLRALTRAAQRGVDVQLLVPRSSDVFFMPWLSAYFYEPLLRGGVHIFEYARSMLHAKSVLIDGWALVGTSNLNQRSLRHDLEVDVVLSKPSSLALLEEAFDADIGEAGELYPLDLRRRPWWQRLVARIGFMCRQWL